jgi:hypothetical protein
MPSDAVTSFVENVRISQFRQKGALKGAIDRMPAVATNK